MGNDVFNENLTGLNDLYRDKTKVNEMKRVKECYVSDSFSFFHYNMYDEVDCGLITGWGCAYRCVQMISSFYKDNLPSLNIEIPKIRQIQEFLASVNYIPREKIGSNMWIEPHHAAVYIRNFLKFETKEVVYYKYKLTLKDRMCEIEEREKKRIGEKGFEVIISKDPSGNDLGNLFLEHFKTIKSVVMVDNSVQAFCVGGVRVMEDVDKSEDSLTTPLRNNGGWSNYEEHVREKNRRKDMKNKKKRSFQVLIFDPHVSRGFKYDSYVSNKNDMRHYGKGVHWVDMKRFFFEKSTYKRWMILFPSRDINATITENDEIDMDQSER